MKNTTDFSLVCPITKAKMQDPVIDPDGNSYEREAILEWIAKEGTSPITRKPLRADQLVPNRALLDLLLPEGAGDGVATGAANREDEKKEERSMPDIKVTVKPVYDDSGLALVQVSASDDSTLEHEPSDVVCVLDVSYSMDSAATMHGDSEGSAGLSLLDIVKHATRTVIETLGSEDRLAVVSYADSAKVELPLSTMTKENRVLASSTVNSLQTRGNTNLWDGVFKAMELIRKNASTRKATILLLTDGVPNVNPPRGILPTLLRYKEKHPELKNCRISTFGFGYSLDSELLNNVALQGGGHFGFIPDSSFVGTTFVNATANILSTALPELTVSIEAPQEQGIRITECLSGQESVATSWGMSVKLPSLIFGQTRDVLVRFEGTLSSGASFNAVVKYTKNDQEFEMEKPFKPVGEDSADNDSLKVAQARSKLIAFICSSKAASNSVSAQLKSLINEFDSEKKSVNGERVTRLMETMLEDLKGQISEAYSKPDWYKRWGCHYLLSLNRAHILQQCTNFKDPGVLAYATEKFSLIRDEAEDTFCTLPPPKPSRLRDDELARRAPVRMSNYYDVDVPCFAAGDMVLANGNSVSVDKVKPGDKIVNSSGAVVTVRCVVATLCSEDETPLVQLDGGVLVTPWHPVRLNGKKQWSFPADVGTLVLCRCTRVYSFILEEGESFFQIGPYDAVSLGHCIVDDPVAKHEYLGTARVVDDLSKMVGWRNGMVLLAPSPMVRDPVTGLVARFEQDLDKLADFHSGSITNNYCAFEEKNDKLIQSTC